MIQYLKSRLKRETPAEMVERLKAQETFPPGLTKTARNEMRRLRATFLNNSAVGLGVAGYLVPTAAILPKLLVMVRHQYEAGNYLYAPIPSEILLAFAAGVIAVRFASFLRRRAERLLVSMED